jgi:hypothetical protein
MRGVGRLLLTVIEEQMRRRFHCGAQKALSAAAMSCLSGFRLWTDEDRAFEGALRRVLDTVSESAICIRVGGTGSGRALRAIG